MNDQLIEQISAALAEILSLVQSVGDELTDEESGLLAQIIEQATQRIQELSSQESPADGLSPETGQAPQLEPGPFPSSNVNSFKYDPRNGRLFVKFHGKDSAESGPTYKYEGVPGFIYDIFSRGAVGPKTSGQNQYHRWIKGVTPSLGAAMNGLIKAGGYPYQRVA